MERDRRRTLWLGLALWAVLLLFYLLQGTSLESGALAPVARWVRVFELKTLDLRLALRGERQPEAPVTIVEIDERSIQELGRYPWDRGVHAALVDRLARDGAAVVAFDVLFSEASDPESDLRFAEAVARSQRVVLAAHMAVVDAPEGQDLRGPVPDRVAYRGFRNLTPEALAAAAASPAARRSRLIPPIAPLADAARAIGLSELGTPDPDQIYRWMPMALEEPPGRFYPPLSLVAVAAYLGVPAGALVLDFGSGLGQPSVNVPVGMAAPAAHGTSGGSPGPVRPPDPVLQIHTDGRFLMPLTFLSGDRPFPYLSYIDVLKGLYNPDQVRGRIVLVGGTAKALFDVRPTPVGVVPGVELHATAIDNILSGSLLGLPGAERLPVMVVLGLVVVFGFARTRPRTALLLATALTAGYAAAAVAAFVLWNRWLHLFYPMVSLLLLTGALGGVGYLTEERQRTITRRYFEKYVPPAVVEEILRNPTAVRLGGERRRVSVLFSDIRGFTSLSEQMAPEAVVTLLNEYFPEMTAIVHRHGGIIDKYEGDGLMAIFGAPLPRQDHAVQAVRAALEMRERLAALRERWKLPIRIGVGIATGEVVMGNVGSEDRLNYTAIGDTVNLAARLQDLTKEYESDILVSPATYSEAVEGLGASAFSAIPDVRVRGKREPLTIYQAGLTRRTEVNPDASRTA